MDNVAVDDGADLAGCDAARQVQRGERGIQVGGAGDGPVGGARDALLIEAERDRRIARAVGEGDSVRVGEPADRKLHLAVHDRGAHGSTIGGVELRLDRAGQAVHDRLERRGGRVYRNGEVVTVDGHGHVAGRDRGRETGIV